LALVPISIGGPLNAANQPTVVGKSAAVSTFLVAEGWGWRSIQRTASVEAGASVGVPR
jgi:hypothetical protein